MRVTNVALALCLLSSAIATPLLSGPSKDLLIPRHGDDEHEHGGDDAPLRHIDEAEILRYHDPDPVSYYQYDYENATVELNKDESVYIDTKVRHGGLMMFHAFVMTVSYLMVLPIHLVLSASGHRLLWLSQAAFWALNLLGLAAGRAYRRSTPNLYQGSVHSKSGGILLLISALIAVIDLVPLFKSVKKEVSGLQLNNHLEWSKWISRLPTWRRWNLKATKEETEYLPVIHSPEISGHSEDLTPIEEEWKHGQAGDEIDMLDLHSPRMATFTSQPSTSMHHITQERLRHIHKHSLGSDHSTLHDDRHSSTSHRPHNLLPSRLMVVAQFVRMVVGHILVIYGWGQALHGLVIYLGWGRAQYINGVLAHFIKGSIFWWYGILTFARYLGAWRRWGWAWNATPEGSQAISASTFESLAIFVYGFTQQFMERFGKHPGDPYTAKDIEHISIAVMFWGGGLVGLAVESPTIRRWLIGESENVEEEASSPGEEISYTKSSPGKEVNFTKPSPVRSRWTAANPLPGVVIGITGIAMSAHHQTYLFQVQIHQLWGWLLLGFAICRSLTCFFDWVRPQKSKTTVPALPPTELIGSIFLGAGGFTFICSTEQITFWAMRTHRDDMMMFLNLAIAFTCVAYVWSTIVLVVVGKTSRKTHLHL